MGAHGTHHPGPCASAMGPALTSALGHARTMWGQGGCAGASPRLARCRPPSADVIGKVARPRALPQLYVCPPLCAVTPPSPSCPLPPPPALCCLPQPPVTGSAHCTNSTAPQGSPGQLAPRPSLPRPQISGHPPCQFHWGLQPVFPADLPGTCLNPAPVTPQPPPSFPTSALATGLPGFAACPAPQEAQTLRCC